MFLSFYFVEILLRVYVCLCIDRGEDKKEKRGEKKKEIITFVIFYLFIKYRGRGGEGKTRYILLYFTF